MSSYLTTSIIRYEANNVMLRERAEYVKEKKKRKRERENTTVPCTSARKVGASPFGFYVDPSMLRSPVRASFAMLRSDKHPPLGPSSAFRHPLRAPLQIDRTIPHARRSSCTASSSASSRPHRGRKRGERAREISSTSSFHRTRSFLVSPCGRCAPPPPKRVRFLLLFSSAASFTSSFSSTAQPRDTLA